jgi:hypothetical protein
MGWLGDGQSYIDEQAATFAAMTFSWQSGNQGERRTIESMFDTALLNLEETGYAIAGSPFQLTERGKNARLTGLSVPTIARLERAVARGREGWLADLLGVDVLTQESATQIARLVFEGLEVAEKSLWMRQISKSKDAVKLELLTAMGSGSDSDFYSDPAYAADVGLVASWIMGQSYKGLAEMAPVFSRSNTLFGGEDESKRTSDATEYIGRLTYPASWVWSGAKVLAGQFGESIPAFIRASVEFGVPSQSAVRLVNDVALSRPASLAVTSIAGTNWEQVVEWILDADYGEIGLTTLDSNRLSAFKDRLTLSSDA